MTPDEIVEAIVRLFVAAEVAEAAKIAEAAIRPWAREMVESETGYLLVEAGRAIMCLRCGAVSHNPTDVEQHYCGACHVFHQ